MESIVDPRANHFNNSFYLRLLCDCDVNRINFTTGTSKRNYSYATFSGDLIVISNPIDQPSTRIHYLQRRYRLNNSQFILFSQHRFLECINILT